MARLIRKSLFLRLSLLILGGTGFVLTAVLLVASVLMRPLLLDGQMQYYQALASDSANEIDRQFVEAQHAVDLLAARMALLPITRENADLCLRHMLERHPQLLGSAVALSPEMDHGAAGYQIVYAWCNVDGYHFVDRSFPTEDYQSDWFYLPYHLEKSVWTDPYYDREVDDTMVTYSAPVIQGGKVLAVVTCDLSLDRIRALLDALELGSMGHPVMATQFGRLIIHPNPRWEIRETLYSLAESAESHEGRESFFAISRMVTHQAAGMFRFRNLTEGLFVWLCFDTIPSTGWRVGFIIPEAQMLAPTKTMLRNMGLIALLGGLLLLIPAFLVSLTITRPLQQLGNAAGRLAAGDFGAKLPPAKGRDEISRLIEIFGRMRVQLGAYIDDLAATTAEKEKVASELAIAQSIQHGILPKLFPPFPERSGLDIFASLKSAREVGGDLYDFALLDDDRLYICIGDVSGKGVPASLFMAVGKTLLKSTIQTLPNPAQALNHVNNELCEGNDTCMFITLFCGILDLKTSVLTYANAGHNPPALVQDGIVTFLDVASRPPLAAMPGMDYQNKTLELPLRSKLVLYTDGVTEAMNPELELYGEERLQHFLACQSCKTAEKYVTTLAADVAAFARGAEQSDDITLLCVSYSGGREMAHNEGSPTTMLVLTNHREEFPKLVAWLEECGAKLGWPQDLLMQLNLVLEEWIVNVVSYAFPDREVHEIELRLWQTDTQVRIEIIDDGVPFDPTAYAPPDLSMPVEQRDVGGLGIHFIRESTDGFTYARQDDRNVVAIVKKIDG